MRGSPGGAVHEQPVATPDRGTRRFHVALAWIVALGVALRLAIALASIGTNDVLIWHAFGRSAAAEGFVQLWRTRPWMNHPPLPVAWAWLGYAVAGESLHAFSLFLKLPGILAEGIAIVLIGANVRRAADDRAGVVAAALLAVNPTSLLVSGYHGNLDAAFAAIVLATWFLASRGRLGWAASALGASLNVKLAAAPTVLLLFACVRTRAQFARVLGGLAIGALPFAMLLAAAGTEALRQIVGYRPASMGWVATLLWSGRSLPAVGPILMFAAETLYKSAGELALLTACGVAWIRLRDPQRRDALTLGALFWAVFMLVDGGGAFQYAIWPVAILAAVRPRWAFAYGVAAAAWLLWAYLVARVPGAPPIRSDFELDTPTPFDVIIPLPVISIGFAAVSLWRGLRSPHDGPEHDRTSRA